MTAPDIRFAPSDPGVAVRAVALLLPGGAADSFEPTRSRQLAGLRMRPFASALQRHGGGHGLAVWSVRYRVRGWNGAHMSPVADVEEALGEVRRRHGEVPVVLVGHSMGGRTAMRVAGDPAVAGVVGLAPWLPDGEPVAQLAGRRVLVAHGTRDRVTSPVASRRFVDRARALADVRFVSIRGETHAMVLRAPVWHRLCTAFVLDLVGVRELPAGVREVLDRGVV